MRHNSEAEQVIPAASIDLTSPSTPAIRDWIMRDLSLDFTRCHI